MALVACPSCGLVRTDTDLEAVACPVCGWKAGEPIPAIEEVAAPRPAESLPEALPLTEPATGPNWWLVGTGAVVVGVIAADLILRPFDQQPGPPADPPADMVGAPPEQIEVAPPPREIQWSGFGLVPVVVPLPVPGPTTPSVIRLSQPDEEFRMDRLADRNHVKLVGRAKRLSVNGLNGGATLDASELVVDQVYVYGVVDGGSTLLVKSPDAQVTFRSTSLVGGGSRVVLDVGSGEVSFAYSGAGDGVKITGGSKVTITGRQIHLGGIGGEGTEVIVTLTPPGQLRFNTIDAGAKLHWRPADPADPIPRLRLGEVKDGAEFKRLP
jgi:hypothetical protein